MKKIYKPILFSTPMVQALDFKEMTRRTQGLEDVNANPDSFLLMKTFEIKRDVYDGKHSGFYAVFNNSDKKEIELKARFQTGDILWVRETWRDGHAKSEKYRYRANYGWLEQVDKLLKWKPSIFMPKDAARKFLEVSNVRCERLQNISCEDCKAEGVIYNPSGNNDVDDLLALESFMALWESINGKDSWQSNPWVWVYEFKKIEKPTLWPQ
jgi:hypothetical protein